MTNAILLLSVAFQSKPVSDIDPGFESYLAHIFSAQASLSMGDTALALRWLDKADAAYRGWEYDFLRAETDMSEWSRPLAHDPARIEFSADGRYAATSNLDGTVTLYDGTTLEPIGALNGHESQVWGVQFSPDGSTIATTSRDFSVRLWDVATRKEVATLGKHTTTPYSCAFSPDGKWVATPGWQINPATKGPAGLISVWDVEKRALHKQWMVTTHPITAVAFSPDGRYAAFGCWEFQTLIYDTRDWSLVREIWPEESETYKAVDWVQFSSDGKRLLTACKDQTARLYEVESGKLLTKYAGKGNATCARFSPDGTKVVTSWTDQNLRVFSPEGTLIATLRGHRDSVRCFALDGTRTVSISEDGTMRAWPATGATVSFDAGDASWSAVPSPDDRMIATGGHGDLVRILSMDGTHVRDLVGAEHLVVDVAWSPDGTRVVGGSNDGTARVWTVADGVLRHTFRIEGSGQVRGVGWSPKDSTVAVGRGRKLVLFDGVTGARKSETTLPQGAYSVAFSKDGRWVAAGRDRRVSIIDPADGSVVKELTEGPAEINEIAWSADGRLIAASGNDGAIHQWTFESGQKRETIRASTLSVWALAYSPDGKRLAMAGYDHSVRLFDVATGAQVFMLRDLPGIGFDVQWTADGRRLIHADTDGRVTVFDAGPAQTRE